MRFLTGLPDPATDPDDDASVDAFVTENPPDPALAVLVEVTATPRTVFVPFARALATLLGAIPPDGQVSAQAIAGYTSYACDVTPLMFCIPPGWTANANVGQAIKLRTGGNSSQWGPGNFGFLDPTDIGINPLGPCAGLNGAPLYICMIAAEGNLTKCVSQRGVDTEPGQRNGIGSAIYNSRFDMFTATMNNLKNKPEYAPGPQVISGWQRGANGCVGNNPTRTVDTMPFPPDDCFEDNTCNYENGAGGGRFGTTTGAGAGWGTGKGKYLDMNYGTGPSVDGEDLEPHTTPGLLNALDIHETRYEMYLDEIARAEDDGRADILTGRQENGRPQCSSAAPNTDPDRRTVIAAAINCNANPVVGRATDVPVQEFVKVFLIQPLEASSGTDFDLFVEVVEQVGGAGGGIDEGIFRDVVRLYR